MLIPRPRLATAGTGVFTLAREGRITAATELATVAERLRSALQAPTGFALPVDLDASDTSVAASSVPGIRLRLDDDVPGGPEGFRLTVTPDGVDVAGASPAGVFSGTQAFLQLLPAAVHRKGRVDGVAWTADAITVEDAPAFAWRGFMLDVARHFRTKAEVLRIIDLLALHRINTLHLHLTEDQGWRIEIKKYPRLTSVGGWRRESQVGAHVPDADGVLQPGSFDGRPHGGFYTQDDIREIVAYAAERFITVVPEIETPGHVRAALAAYPELGVAADARTEPLEVWTEWGICHDVLNVEESTVTFFQDVLDEVMALFPSAYIGIGGDECPKDQWEQDPRTQERMRELGIPDEEQLQAWFIGRLAEHVTAAGRRVIGWDEILEGGTLDRSATVLSWRGMTGAITAARRGYDVVSVPDDQAYFDYRQSDDPAEPIPVSIVLTAQDVYAFDPVPDALTPAEAEHVIGGQANLWSEHIDSARTVDYLMFPRLVALAEALWSADVAGPRSYEDFAARLPEHLERLDALGVEYRHDSGPFPWQERPGVPGRPMTREARAEYMEAVTANIVD